MSRFMNPRFDALAEYVPGEQPRDMTYVKLNTNESPFPPSPGVIKAISAAEIEKLRLYPDPDCTALKAALAAQYGVKPEQISMANGSDDILNFSFLAFGADGVVFPDITYGFYPVFAHLHNLDYTEVPLKSDFTVDIDRFCSTGKLVVLANPNAPTGISLPLDAIAEIARSNKDHVVLIDEAYVDFGGITALPLVEKYENLLVVRTYSKSRSLAGARLGFALAQPTLIRDLEKLRNSTNPYNINRLTDLAGTAALAENDYYAQNCKTVMAVREQTVLALKERGFEVLPSCTNFLFAKWNKMDGKALYEALKQRGILVRHFTLDRIADYNRITVGTADDMRALLHAIDAIGSAR